MGINTFSFYQHQRIGKRVPVAAGQRQQRLEQRRGRILTPPHTPGTARGGHSPRGQGLRGTRVPGGFVRTQPPAGKITLALPPWWQQALVLGFSSAQWDHPRSHPRFVPGGGAQPGSARGATQLAPRPPGALQKRGVNAQRTKSACVCPETSVPVLNLLLPFFFVFFPHQRILHVLNMAINVFISNRVNISQIKGTAHVQKQDL